MNNQNGTFYFTEIDGKDSLTLCASYLTSIASAEGKKIKLAETLATLGFELGDTYDPNVSKPHAKCSNRTERYQDMVTLATSRCTAYERKLLEYTTVEAKKLPEKVKEARSKALKTKNTWLGNIRDMITSYDKLQNQDGDAERVVKTPHTKYVEAVANLAKRAEALFTEAQMKELNPALNLLLKAEPTAQNNQ